MYLYLSATWKWKMEASEMRKTGKCWRAAREREGDSDTYTQGDKAHTDTGWWRSQWTWTCPLCWHVKWCCCCSSSPSSFFTICIALIALFSLFQALKSVHLTFHFEQVITSRYLLLNCHKYCKCGKHNKYIFWLSSFDLFIYTLHSGYVY